MTTYTYYRTTFEVEWADGHTEEIVCETSHEIDRMPGGSRIRVVREFDHAYKKYEDSLIVSTRVRESFNTVRELNFEHIWSIDFIESEKVEIEHD